MNLLFRTQNNTYKYYTTYRKLYIMKNSEYKVLILSKQLINQIT